MCARKSSLREAGFGDYGGSWVVQDCKVCATTIGRCLSARRVWDTRAAAIESWRWPMVAHPNPLLLMAWASFAPEVGRVCQLCQRCPPCLVSLRSTWRVAHRWAGGICQWLRICFKRGCLSNDGRLRISSDDIGMVGQRRLRIGGAVFAPNACGLVQFGNQRVAVFTSHVGLHGSAPSSVKHLPSPVVSMQKS